MSAGIIAWIRTIVPVVVGAAIAWLVTLGISLDKTTENALVVGITGLVIAGYYTLVHLLEKKFPQVGVLLGVAKTADSYTKGALPAIDVPAVQIGVGVVDLDTGTGSPIYDEVSAGIVAN